MNKKARIIVSAHPKGGVGKTMLTQSLGAALGKRGFRTLITDCDPQGSCSAIAASATDDAPFPAAVVNLSSFGGKIHREIQRHVENYDFILIDTPPGLDSLPAQASMIFADLCLIPLQLSAVDVWATIPFKKMVETALVVNPSLKAALLPNRVERTSLSKSILQQLESFGIPVMASRLSNRIAFQEAAISGIPVASLGRTARLATGEINSLTDEVLTLLGENDGQ